MRAILSVLVALSVAGPGASQLLAQSDRAPVFRSGVEVMEVDVTVVDAKGMPVRDLRVPEFTVTIDGQPRRVVSAEFISESTTPSGEPAEAPRSVRFEQHRSPPWPSHHARDRSQQHRHAHGAERRGVPQEVRRRASLRMTGCRSSRFRRRDQSVDFTTNHALILDALSRIIGSDDSMLSRFNISDYEAITFENRSNPIVTQRLLYRACGDTDPNTLSPCDRDVEQEALTIATHIRQLTSRSRYRATPRC